MAYALVSRFDVTTERLQEVVIDREAQSDADANVLIVAVMHASDTHGRLFQL